MPTRKASDVPESGQPQKSLPRLHFSLSGFGGVRGRACAVLCNLYAIVCKTLPVVGGVAVLAITAVPAPVTAREDAGAGLEAQRVVDLLRERLGITAVVSVTVVDRDPRVMSVRANRDVRGAFDLSIDRGFAAGLPAAQLEAALAHELGHVWISTHHPYLQTEQLANRVAMRVVPRERLVEVYRALWGSDALHGSLEAFLGVEPTVTAAQQ